MVQNFLVINGKIVEVENFSQEKLSTNNVVDTIHTIKLYGYNSCNIGYGEEIYQEDFDYDIFEYRVKGNVSNYQLKLLAIRLLKAFQYDDSLVNTITDFSKGSILIKDKIYLSFSQEESYNENIYSLRETFEKELLPLFTEKEKVLLALPTYIIEDCLINLKINFKDFSFRTFALIENYFNNLNSLTDEVDEWGFEL